MRQVISALNDMSFSLPAGWQKSNDVYNLPNGQGMTNLENYVSPRGEVISLFAVNRDPDEFFEGYDRVAKNSENVSGKFNLMSCPSIRSNGFIFPVYIVRGHGDKNLLMVQVFCNCGDCLACFMVNVHSFDMPFKEALKTQPLADLVKILKTIE